MDNQILLEQLFSFWPQVNIVRWVPALDSLTKICIVNFKGHKTLVLLDELVYTSEKFGVIYLTGRMQQIKTLMSKYQCTAGLFITVNKKLSRQVYKTAMSKRINLVDMDDFRGICHKLNCPYLINFLTIQVNLDLIT